MPTIFVTTCPKAMFFGLTPLYAATMYIINASFIKGVDPDEKVGGGRTGFVTKPFTAGGLGGAVSPPQWGPGRSPGGKRIWAKLYRNLASSHVSESPSTPLIPISKNAMMRS